MTIPLVSRLFNMLMYADDTTLYCNLTNIFTEHDINHELDKITDWLTSNKLSLNVKKTKFMVFHTHQKVVHYQILKINNIPIEQVKQFNFLGLIIDSTLKWNSHVNHIALKVSRVIGILYRLKHIYTPNQCYLCYIIHL